MTNVEIGDKLNTRHYGKVEVIQRAGLEVLVRFVNTGNEEWVRASAKRISVAVDTKAQSELPKNSKKKKQADAWEMVNKIMT